MSYATKPQHNLSVSPLPRHSLCYTAARAAFDSYRSAQAGDESLTGSRLVQPCSNQFGYTNTCPYFRLCQEPCGLSEVPAVYFAVSIFVLQWIHTERMKFHEVKVLEVRLCLVSFGSIDRQTDSSWEQVSLYYAPTRSLKLLRHPMRHKIPQRLHALAVLCDASHLLHECSINPNDEMSMKEFFIKECVRKETRTQALHCRS